LVVRASFLLVDFNKQMNAILHMKVAPEENNGDPEVFFLVRSFP
jgi:hypothetical protein